MFKRRSLVALLLVMVLILSACGGPAETTEKPEDVTEDVTEEETTIKVDGHNGEIEVLVGYKGDELTKVEILSHSETDGIADPAINDLPKEMVAKQSTDVDIKSGATVSSEAIINAVKSVLEEAGVTLTPVVTEEEEETSEAEYPLEGTTDVIIIGSGGAGMSAAYEAKKAGAEVIVLEKNGFLGGNTKLAGSAMNAADPEVQREMEMVDAEVSKIDDLLALTPHDEYMERWMETVRQGMEERAASGENYLYDSPDLHKLQTYVGGDYVANPDLLEVYGDKALESVHFLSDLGAEWQEGVGSAIGSTWVRSHNPTHKFGPSGSSFVLPQAEAYEEMGGEVYLNYKAEEIIMEDGRAVGVKGTTNDGDAFEFRANKGVVIATGGFGANIEMRQKYNKHWADLGEGIGTTNGDFAVGDGIVMGENAGANLVGMEWIQLVPSGPNFTASIDDVIMVSKAGERFVKEDGRRDEICGAILELPEKYCFHVFDQKLPDKLGGVSMRGGNIEDWPDGKIIFRADSLEELAEALGSNPETLVNTVNEYNETVDNGNDKFGRKIFGVKIDQAPFYAIRNEPMVHHTMGGIEINENTQVLDKDGNVIPGLFAAGEVTGGIHGANRLGGNAITDVITFGRIAGQNVVK